MWKNVLRIKFIFLSVLTQFHNRGRYTYCICYYVLFLYCKIHCHGTGVHAFLLRGGQIWPYSEQVKKDKGTKDNKYGENVIFLGAIDRLLWLSMISFKNS